MPAPVPEVGYVETRAGDLLIEGDAVGRLDRAFAQLDRCAMAQDSSCKMIAMAAEDQAREAEQAVGA
jgi:hypothetical protein